MKKISEHLKIFLGRGGGTKNTPALETGPATPFVFHWYYLKCCFLVVLQVANFSVVWPSDSGDLLTCSVRCLYHCSIRHFYTFFYMFFYLFPFLSDSLYPFPPFLCTAWHHFLSALLLPLKNGCSGALRRKQKDLDLRLAFIKAECC